MKHLSLLALPLVLAACGPAPETTTSAAGAPSPYAFEVNLTLTPRAAETLVAAKEQVIVDAMYFGMAISEDAPGVDEHGMDVHLGSNEIAVDPVNAVVKAPGTGFDGTNIASIKGEPEVLVNVYSSGVKQPQGNNKLDCGIYQGPVAMAQKQPVPIACDLIDWPEGVAVETPSAAAPPN